jgi:hypothetical protein
LGELQSIEAGVKSNEEAYIIMLDKEQLAKEKKSSNSYKSTRTTNTIIKRKESNAHRKNKYITWPGK